MKSGILTYKIGNAIEPETKSTIICHIVNSVGAWGAGFVVPLGNKYPHVKSAYHRYYDNVGCFTDSKGVETSHSKYWMPFMLGESQIVKAEEGVYVANMVAQKMGHFHGKPPIRYEALEECLHRVADTALALDIETVTGPKFGSGLSAGHWPTIEGIIIDTICHVGLNMDIYTPQELKK
jgi:hypothetical protein